MPTKKKPAQLDSSQPNVLLVGDGGKDPAAEEYVLVPQGAEVVVAPKSDPKEKPTMENAVVSLLKMMMQGEQPKRAAGGVQNTPFGVITDGSAAPSALPSSNFSVSASGVGPNTRSVGMLRTPKPSQFSNQSSGGAVDPEALRRQQQGYEVTKLIQAQGRLTPEQVAVFKTGNWDQLIPMLQGGPGAGGGMGDLGVGVNPTAPAAPIPMASTPVQPQTPFTEPGSPLLAGRATPNNFIGNALSMLRNQRAFPMKYGGMVVNKAKDGLIHAQFGYNPMWQGAPTPKKSSSPSIVVGGGGPNTSSQPDAYQKAQLDLQSQELAAQREMQAAALANAMNIASKQIAAQQAIANMQNQTNLQRLALDRLLGGQQNQLVAQQQLATRATRQLAAPGGNVIPSLQPMLGRTI